MFELCNREIRKLHGLVSGLSLNSHPDMSRLDHADVICPIADGKGYPGASVLYHFYDFALLGGDQSGEEAGLGGNAVFEEDVAVFAIVGV